METSDSSSITGLLILAVVLILLSMIFSASESAFLSINKLRLRLLERYILLRVMSLNLR